MIEAVVLGVGGVLQPRTALWGAEVDAACRWLDARGLPAARLRAAAASLRGRGHRADIGSCVQTAALGLPGRAARDLLVAARRAVPDQDAPGIRADLVRLRLDHRLAFLDQGDGSRMDAWLARLGVGDLGERRLWTGDLGLQAHPPRPLPFRWLARRLDLPSDRCLYVPGTADLQLAARRAGWRVWEAAPPPADRAIDLAGLTDALDAGRLDG